MKPFTNTFTQKGMIWSLLWPGITGNVRKGVIAGSIANPIYLIGYPSRNVPNISKSASKQGIGKGIAWSVGPVRPAWM
jgi:hypothetical protein